MIMHSAGPLPSLLVALLPVGSPHSKPCAMEAPMRMHLQPGSAPNDIFKQLFLVFHCLVWAEKSMCTFLALVALQCYTVLYCAKLQWIAVWTMHSCLLAFKDKTVILRTTFLCVPATAVVNREGILFYFATAHIFILCSSVYTCCWHRKSNPLVGAHHCIPKQ